MVTLRRKDNALEPANHIASLLSSALDLSTQNLIRNIFIPWVDHMPDMVTLGGKANTSMPGKHSVYRQKDRYPDSSIPTHPLPNLLGGGGVIIKIKGFMFIPNIYFILKLI